MGYAFGGVIAVAVLGFCGRLLFTRRRDSALRKLARAREVTYRMSVGLREQEADGDWVRPLWGPVDLIIRGEWIEFLLRLLCFVRRCSMANISSRQRRHRLRWDGRPAGNSGKISLS